MSDNHEIMRAIGGLEGTVKLLVNQQSATFRKMDEAQSENSKRFKGLSGEIGKLSNQVAVLGEVKGEVTGLKVDVDTLKLHRGKVLGVAIVVPVFITLLIVILTGVFK